MTTGSAYGAPPHGAKACVLGVLLLGDPPVLPCIAAHHTVKCCSCRWQSILRQHSGSGRLWRAYTAWQRTRFAGFTVSSMQQAYRQALAVRFIWNSPTWYQLNMQLTEHGTSHIVLLSLACKGDAR